MLVADLNARDMALVTLLPTSAAVAPPEVVDDATSLETLIVVVAGLEPDVLCAGDVRGFSEPPASDDVDDDVTTGSASLVVALTGGGGRPVNRKFLMLFESSRHALLNEDIGEVVD